jgi:hypothetical protein
LMSAIFFVIPAYCIALAWIAASPAHRIAGMVSRRVSATHLGIAAVGLLCVASLYSLGNYYMQPQYAKSPGWRELVQFIVGSAGPSDTVVQNYPDPSLSYYLDGRLPLEVIPSGAPLQMGPTMRQLERVKSSSRLIWFLPYPSPDWDEDGFVETWLGQNSIVMSDQTIGSISLQVYRGGLSAGGSR